ncbi:MAG: sigma-54-dependent Fis family transcriptional regulator [Pseudomonadales bacterium]|nr:sigma-54-dependent Fis family transcriptional regulator [Pseudomonadales bacterium]MCP5331381.1 sigma-54-dependent Fis family transcriptional regulator [Pseudomonadales bacterium]MCP5344390.1 sigma-54-dependent Fis family transcriptional regulator [Pseudomonadales bacterium]
MDASTLNPSAQGKILLIDDNRKARDELEVILGFLGETVVATNLDGWQSAAGQQLSSSADIKLTMLGPYPKDAQEALVATLAQWDMGIPVVLLGDTESGRELATGVQNAITACVPLPLRYQPVLDALHKSQVYRRHYQHLSSDQRVRDYNMFRSLVGNSAEVQRIRHVMGQVADKEVTILITGESGTGKEVVARNLHKNSSRANKPFVPINCGAIPPDLLESELFGHEKGAFTGAISTRIGRFEMAEGGTLFLDEIGDMPLPMQVKLLRVLQEHCYERVGGTKTLQTDVRILAATHKNLEDMIDAGTFRQDLYYRINVFPIEMPSLRDRAEDIPYLLNELITRLECEKRGSVRFNSSAIESLCRHPWPGNVRELANLVERMAILHPHAVVGVNDLPQKFRHLEAHEIAAEALVPEHKPVHAQAPTTLNGNGSVPQALLPLNGLDLKEYLANLERDLIEQALNDSGGVVARAADRLNIRRTTLVEKMRKYEMQR